MAADAAYLSVLQLNRWGETAHGSKRTSLSGKRCGIVHSDRMIALVIIIPGRR